MNFINLSERAYKYIRQFTIKSPDDALVELITNCIDAYNKTTIVLNRVIHINVYDDNKFDVIDNALGLTSEELKACFLQVGNYTATNESRGFFSRGAKDISALGNISFDAIKNGMYSQCILTTDAYGCINIADIPVTHDQREQFSIPENGLSVTVGLLDNFRISNVTLLYNTISRLAVLRDIISDSANVIMFNVYKEGDLVSSDRMQYTYPPGLCILNIEYNIPQYIGKKATFVVYKVNEPIVQPAKETMMEFGFLMKDSTTVYEVNTLDGRFRWNPYISYLYGYIFCDDIKDMLLAYDTHGPTSTNPYPIIDPSRITGLNRMHPFIVQMLGIPLVRLDYILRDLNRSISSHSITIEDVGDLLNELEKHGVDLIKKENVKVNFLPSYDQNLIKAIEDSRSKYVDYEVSNELDGSYNVRETETNRYIQDKIATAISDSMSPSEHYFAYSDDSGIIDVTHYSDIIRDTPEKLLELVSTDVLTALKQNPYIYSESDTKQLIRLYIFQKGVVDIVPDLKADVKTQNKMFVIEFINDINIPLRYVIDDSNGIVIKLNLHNPQVGKYLYAGGKIESYDFFKLAQISSTQSLVFLKELVCDILSDLILVSDAENGKLAFDSTSQHDNAKKAIEYRNYVVCRIENIIDSVFGTYVSNNINGKIDMINKEIDIVREELVKTVLASSSEADLDNLKVMENMLKVRLSSLIE